MNDLLLDALATRMWMVSHHSSDTVEQLLRHQMKVLLTLNDFVRIAELPPSGWTDE